MSDFQNIFQPVSREEVRRRKDLDSLESMVLGEKCIDCDHWMKISECSKEVSSPAMSMFNTCSKFKLKFYYLERLAKLRKEM